MLSSVNCKQTAVIFQNMEANGSFKKTQTVDFFKKGKVTVAICSKTAVSFSQLCQQMSSWF